jgi:asparagine synthase (glutamine-hydrolysing)
LCGFVGFTEPVGDADACLDLAGRMLAMLAHRGPDGARSHHRDGVTFAHCALPFVGGDDSCQPFVSASGHTTVVFNGEIYNHATLRCELTRTGVRLRTTGDTELLAELYEREELGFLQRVRGMFAIAFHDMRRHRLVLVRDPLGKKPLYYAGTGDRIIFASELGALLAHPACPRELDPSALADYLTLRAFPAPSSALSGVLKVRPGAYVVAGAGGRRETTYYTPRLAAVRRRDPIAVQEDEFAQLLISAVERRLRSTDETLGVLLSGGVDSSVVAAVAGQVTGRPPPTFSARFADPAFDESRAAEAVARHLGTEHHPVSVPAAALAEAADEELRRIDEPLADPSLLPTILVCRAARRRVRGVLTGDGADELLLGYRFFQAERVLEAVRRIVPVTVLTRLGDLAARAPARHSNLPLESAVAQLARGLLAAPEQRYYESTRPFAAAELAELLQPGVLAAVGEHRPYRELERLLAQQDGLSPLERSQVGIIGHFLRDVILTKVDRGSMGSGLEARSPFLDLDVVDYCSQLPADRKLRQLTGKYLLRRVAARWLPADVARRKKVGFRVPIAALLCGELRPLLLDSLDHRRLAAHGLFDPAVVRRMVDEHLSRRSDHAGKLWTLLCFQLWHDGTLCRATDAAQTPQLRPVGDRDAP